MTNSTFLKRLDEIAIHLDISPSDYELSRQRFGSVATWLAEGEYQSGSQPEIYLQGSFRLGTVVKPYRDGKDAGFDIDQVFELSQRNATISARGLKDDVGKRLKSHSDYNRMLDEEGKRCWTLLYASEENRPGFHIDVLPSAIGRGGIEGEIDITDKSAADYEWARSNPKGYYSWFRSKNPFSDDFVRGQKEEIYEGNRELYTDANTVPRQLLRSPLQRAVQIMKRHRDVYFSTRDRKPISIIITTIATHQYAQEDVLQTIKRFCRYVICRHQEILTHDRTTKDGVLDYLDDGWEILNPAENGIRAEGVENFADKWNKDEDLPASFFEWVYKLYRDIDAFDTSGISDDLGLAIKRFGEGERFSTIRSRSVGESLDTNQLLDLIYLAIEGKVEWDRVSKLAEQIVQKESPGETQDIARLNFYQIARHRNRTLASDAIKDVQRIIRDNPDSAGFRLGGNLILGTATHQMLKETLLSWNDFSSPLEWPILRLADRSFMMPQ